MKILLAYVFLQAAMPSYLLACSRSENKQSLQAQNIYRRDLGAQPTQGYQDSVGRLQRRSHHGHGGQHHHHTHPSDDSSGDDSSDSARRGRLHQTGFRRRALYRRGDYSMLQSKHSPIGNLHRRQVQASKIAGDEGDLEDSDNSSAASGDDNGTIPASLNNEPPPEGGVFDRLGKWGDQAKDEISKLFQ
ncbi:hypothetical protein IWQ61_006325 [Dispira simplex]|nr:hypothetical protein IWQ61_006325 [Dispira simplex]